MSNKFPLWNRTQNSIYYGALTWEEANHYAFEDWIKAFNKCFDDSRANGTYPPNADTIPDPTDFRKYWYQLELKLVGGKGEKPKDPT